VRGVWVKFSKPSLVMRITSSIRTPPKSFNYTHIMVKWRRDAVIQGLSPTCSRRSRLAMNSCHSGLSSTSST
jgi:hypothetical protein